jgi:hypothetical protein
MGGLGWMAVVATAGRQTKIASFVHFSLGSRNGAIACI